MNQFQQHKESYYQTKIMKWLKEEYPDAFVWKAQAGPYSRQGIPDILVVLQGHLFAFEVKRPKLGRLSKIQELTIEKINAAGGTAAVVSYPEDAERIILALQKKRSAEDWILVKDKLPPRDVDVLVYWVNHASGSAYYAVEYLGGPGWDSLSQKAHLEIVAWMSLPDPPERRMVQ